MLWGDYNEQWSFFGTKCRNLVPAPEIRAVGLLSRIIDKESFGKYCYTGNLSVVGQITGEIYVLRRSETVIKLSLDNHPCSSYCIHTKYDDGLPPTDTLIAQLLLLTSHEKKFLNIANLTKRDNNIKIFIDLLSENSSDINLYKSHEVEDEFVNLYLDHNVPVQDVKKVCTWDSWKSKIGMTRINHPTKINLSVISNIDNHIIKSLRESHIKPNNIKSHIDNVIKLSVDDIRTLQRTDVNFLDALPYDITNELTNENEPVEPTSSSFYILNRKQNKSYQGSYAKRDIHYYESVDERFVQMAFNGNIFTPYLNKEGKYITQNLAAICLQTTKYNKLHGKNELKYVITNTINGTKKIPLCDFKSNREVDDIFLAQLVYQYTNHLCKHRQEFPNNNTPFIFTIMNYSTYRGITGGTFPCPINFYRGQRIIIDDRVGSLVISIPIGLDLGRLLTYETNGNLLAGIEILEPQNIKVSTRFKNKIFPLSEEGGIEIYHSVFPDRNILGLEYDMLFNSLNDDITWSNIKNRNYNR